MFVFCIKVVVVRIKVFVFYIKVFVIRIKVFVICIKVFVKAIKVVVIAIKVFVIAIKVGQQNPIAKYSHLTSITLSLPYEKNMLLPFLNF